MMRVKQIEGGAVGYAVQTDVDGSPAWKQPYARYLVAPAGAGAMYASVQGAINAAVADGHGTASPAIVVVLPGTYVGAVALAAGIDVVGVSPYPGATTIDGDVSFVGAVAGDAVTLANVLVSGRITSDGAVEQSLQLGNVVAVSSEASALVELANSHADSYIRALNLLAYASGAGASAYALACSGPGTIVIDGLSELKRLASDDLCAVLVDGGGTIELTSAYVVGYVSVAASSALSGDAIHAVTSTVAPLQVASTGAAVVGALRLQTGASASASGAGSVTVASVAVDNGAPVTASTPTLTPTVARIVASVADVTGAAYSATGAAEVVAVTAPTGGTTVTLPASPVRGERYTVSDVAGTAPTRNITIAGNGKLIAGSSTLVLAAAYSSATLVYSGASWIIT